MPAAAVHVGVDEAGDDPAAEPFGALVAVVGVHRGDPVAPHLDDGVVDDAGGRDDMGSTEPLDVVGHPVRLGAWRPRSRRTASAPGRSRAT